MKLIYISVYQSDITQLEFIQIAKSELSKPGINGKPIAGIQGILLNK